MGEQEDDDEYIHARCSEEFKRRINLAAAATDRNLSEYVREELGDAAEEDLDGVVVDDIRVGDSGGQR
jgi:uncharacterized protein (DUF1778 family)